jgi:hypothetical protein
MPPKIKHRVRTRVADVKGRVFQDNETTDTFTYGRTHWVNGLSVPTKIGEKATYIVTVEYLGECQYKQTFEQRTKAFDRNQERTKKWKEEQAKLELERQEKQLVQRRCRITNQIELAFVKQVATAVNFITCDKCHATATFLGLAYENPGSDVIDPDQITGAWCQEHDNKYQRPFKTKAAIACERLEFFYDGLRQLYVKNSAEHKAA